MNTLRAINLAFAVVMALAVLLGIGLINLGTDVAQEVVKTTKQEVGPSALLKKYEWFKNASAELDRKHADIKVYDGRLKAMIADYKNKPRPEWPREDREQYNLWTTELAGIKSSYNALAAEYNAQMAKDNWRFTNRGQLPQGTTEPLPREFRTYVTE